MKKLLVLLGVCLLIIGTWFYWPSGNKINSYNQVRSVFQQADQDTLVIFDVDDTLIVSQDLTSRSAFLESIEGWLYRIYYWFGYAPERTKEYENKLFHAVFAKAKFQLIEPDIKDYITELQKRSVKVIACTAMSPGKLVMIEKSEEWRYQHLAELGIDFSSSFKREPIVFDNLQKQKGSYPMYYKGILCASHNPKGIVIGAFLDRIDWTPKKIIFFDDSADFIRSVRDEMKKRNIPCECYQYLGARHMPGIVDRRVARLQLKRLIEHAEWLNDQEAKTVIEQQEYSHVRQ